MATRHAAVYCRLSPRPDGSYEGVAAQKGWGLAYAAKMWPGVPVEVFADEGISAANGDHRPQFERFREWLTAGRIAHVWTVEQTRLERREVEWFRLAAELDAAGIDEVHTDRDGIVRVRDEVAGIKAVLAASEVRKLKRRVNDRLAEIAANGRPPGSCPFGYRRATTDEGVPTYRIVPEEAAVIRQAAEWVLAGWSLGSIAKELRNRGLKGPLGGKISFNSSRSIITNATIAGKRVYQGRIIGEGNWEPILDETTWRECRVRLSTPREVRTANGRNFHISEANIHKRAGRKYLLTGGLIICDVCEMPMAGSIKQYRRKSGKISVPYLQCHPTYGGRGCTGIMLEPTEQLIVDSLFDELDKPEFLEKIGSDDYAARRDEIIKKLDAIEHQRHELAKLWSIPGELSMSEWKIARDGLAETEQSLRMELSELPKPNTNVDISGARDVWHDMILDEKREFLRMFIEQVRVKPIGRGSKGFKPERVIIKFRCL